MKNLPCLGLAILASCGLFGGSVEQPEIDHVDVVAKDAAFDPRQAVDDKDEAGKGAMQQKDGAGNNAPPPPEPVAAHGDEEGEHVATQSEVEGMKKRRQQRLEQAEGEASDSTAKEQIAHNPPAEPLGEGPGVGWTVTQYALEGAMVAGLALLISGLVVLLKRFPRTAGSTLLGAATLLALWMFVQAG